MAVKMLKVSSTVLSTLSPYLFQNDPMRRKYFYKGKIRRDIILNSDKAPNLKQEIDSFP